MPQENVLLMDHVATLSDPRSGNAVRHNGYDILIIALGAAVCGADAWRAVETFGSAKEAWLRRFLALPHGIPSHDTFTRVFAARDSDGIAAAFIRWTGAVTAQTAGEVIAIDGPTLRPRYDRQSDQAALQMVRAWASHHRLVLGQVAVDTHSNAITAIPKLLQLLAVSGCIVTIDAIGCQQDSAKQMVEQGADDVLAVKATQGSLWNEAHACFAKLDEEMSTFETQETGHGRYELRR